MDADPRDIRIRQLEAENQAPSRKSRPIRTTDRQVSATYRRTRTRGCPSGRPLSSKRQGQKTSGSAQTPGPPSGTSPRLSPAADTSRCGGRDAVGSVSPVWRRSPHGSSTLCPIHRRPSPGTSSCNQSDHLCRNLPVLRRSPQYASLAGQHRPGGRPVRIWGAELWPWPPGSVNEWV